MNSRPHYHLLPFNGSFLSLLLLSTVRVAVNQMNSQSITVESKLIEV